MGLYALAPGTPDYVLGAPLFAHMSLTVEGSNATIDIVANNTGPDNVYVQVREQRKCSSWYMSLGQLVSCSGASATSDSL